MAHRPFTKRDRIAILRSVAIDGNLTTAAKSIGRSRPVLVSYLSRNPKFKAKVVARRKEAWDALEAEAYRRAVMGVRKPVYQQGRKVGSVTEYSDGLLGTLLRARLSTLYDKPQKHDVEARHNWADLLKIAREGGTEDARDMELDEEDEQPDE